VLSLAAVHAPVLFYEDKKRRRRSGSYGLTQPHPLSPQAKVPFA
jgi:hypothetical protein